VAQACSRAGAAAALGIRWQPSESSAGLADGSGQGKSEGEMRLGQGCEDCIVREMTLATEPSELGLRTRANSNKT
jgi:hypothetical protein